MVRNIEPVFASESRALAMSFGYMGGDDVDLVPQFIKDLPGVLCSLVSDLGSRVVSACKGAKKRYRMSKWDSKY